MGKPSYTDITFQGGARADGLPTATATGHAVPYQQLYPPFSKAELDAICVGPQSLIFRRYEVSNGAGYDVSGSAITRLIDLSGNGRDLRNINGTQRPTLVTSAFGGATDNYAVQFTGASTQYLREETSGGVAVSQTYTNGSMCVLNVLEAPVTGNNPICSIGDPVLTNNTNSLFACLIRNAGSTVTQNGYYMGSNTSLFTSGNPTYAPSVIDNGCIGGIAYLQRPGGVTANRSTFYQVVEDACYKGGGDGNTIDNFMYQGGTQCYFMGVRRSAGTTVYGSFIIKAHIVINLNSNLIPSYVPGSRNPAKDFIRRVAGYLCYRNPWGLKIDPNQ